MCVIVFCIDVMMSNHDTRCFCFRNVLPEVHDVGYGMKVTPKQLLIPYACQPLSSLPSMIWYIIMYD